MERSKLFLGKTDWYTVKRIQLKKIIMPFISQSSISTYDYFVSGLCSLVCFFRTWTCYLVTCSDEMVGKYLLFGV